MTKGRKAGDDRGRVQEMVRGRFDRLFTGAETPPAPINIREMEALKARIATLEAALSGPATGPLEAVALQTGGSAPAEASAKASPAAASAGRASGPSALLRGAGEAFAAGWRQFSKSRLQVRLAVLILIVTVPMLVGLTAFLSASAESRLEASANAALQQNTDAMATNISTWLDQNVRTLQEMVSLHDIRAMNPWGQIPVLKSVAAAHPYMYLVSTTDMTGKNVARNDNATLLDYKDRIWFTDAAKGAALTFQTLIGKTSGRPALVASVPIRDAAGGVVGVGMFAADLTHLSEQTRVATLGKTGSVYLVDAANNVLAHPDPAFTSGELRDLSAYPAVAALRQGQTGLIRFADENGVVWRAYGRILENGWAVLSQEQEAEILAPARDFQRLVYGLIALGTAFMLALLWLSIRRTLQPIEQLTDAASAIAAGNFSRTIEVTSQDELGVLARTFNSMTSQLSATVTTLEQKVRDRTHDLELASDVGRAVSSTTTDIDALLSNAVETIRQRFDLYYVQVYLADPDERMLTLRAGTGEVGSELRRRGHRLPIGTGSLNGRAASERRPVLVADTAQSESFLPNPLLPNTRSEVSIPLLVGGKVLGVLDMQSDRPGALAESNLTAFEVLAGQLAVALQNSASLAQAAQARSEIAEQVRRLGDRGWQDFLDGVDRGHRLGFAFDQNRVIPLNGGSVEAPGTPTPLQVPIRVGESQIGAISVSDEADRGWNDWEKKFAQSTARLIGQHVENLRLVAEAQRYREQAEESARRLTGEGWDEYVQSRDEAAPGYAYDLQEVQPIAASGGAAAGDAVRQPLRVRNQAIGELAAKIDTKSDGAAEILAAVAERTSLHIETLRLMQELEKRAAELRELDRLKTAFLANMSHELRTPLNSILGFADVILEGLDGPLTGNMTNDLQLIQKNGQHLLHLINDVLDMAKISAGRMNLNPEKFRVRDVIEDAVNIAAPLAASKSLVLAVQEGADQDVEIVADPTRIRQVMLNVVNNAVKFTETGGVEIGVTRADANVLISVRDTGVGIPPDHLETVFQEFTQVDTSETRKAGGTGLGLPISRKLIEMHGGRMWAESMGIPGEGTTLYVELPIECKILEPIEELVR